MLEKGLAVGLSIAGILAATIIPIIIELIRRSGKRGEAEEANKPTFGMTVDPEVWADARKTQAELLAEVKGQRDYALVLVDEFKTSKEEAEDRLGEMELRLDKANAALARAGLPLY